MFPLVAIAFLPLILLYYMIQQFYRRSSREIKVPRVTGCPPRTPSALTHTNTHTP